MLDGIGKTLAADLTTPEALFKMRQALGDLLKEHTIHVEARWDSVTNKLIADITFKGEHDGVH